MFAAVFGKSAGAVERTIRRLGIAGPDLRDVEQEAWLAVWKATDRLDGASPAAPEKLASTIAYRKAADHLKMRSRRPEQPMSSTDLEPADGRPTSEEQIVQSEGEQQARVLVLGLLEELPLGERSIVALADFEPTHSMAEIAEELCISEEAARSRHRRAHERMKESLARKRKSSTATGVLFPAVAMLDLGRLLAIEAPPPPLAADEQGALWSRVMSALGDKTLAVGGGLAAAVLTTKQALAGALVAFVLGMGANEALHAARTPTPQAIAAEVIPVVTTPSAAPTQLAKDSLSAPLVEAPAPTSPPSGVSRDHEVEWQAIRDARGLLRAKPPAPDAALAVLKRVHAAELRDIRDRLRAEAESLKRPSP